MKNTHTLKVISSMALLLVVILVSGIYSTRTLRLSANELEQQISRIEQSASAGDWNKAKENLESIESKWTNTHKIWTVLLDHVEIDNIETSISKMSKYIEAQDKPLALGEAAILKQYIKHIPEKESFKIKNIL